MVDGESSAHKMAGLNLSLATSPSSMPSSLPPKHARVLIIGGGPAGSYAASVLAREGISVTVLEADRFPRYHVGESLIPSIRHYMRFIGADDKLSSYGFVHKPGSAIKFNQYKREGYTDFMALGTENAAYNVVRSEFDHLLMSHARSSGAAVYEQTKVKSVSFSPLDPDRPVSVTWSHIPPPEPLSPPASPTVAKTIITPLEEPAPAAITGTTHFDYLIDATGRAGLLSTMYLKNRHFNSSLKNIAVWAYWSGVSTYGVGTTREGAPWFEALTGLFMAWFIPLHTGVTSVGIVMNQKLYNEKEKESTPSVPAFASIPSNSSVVNRYLSSLSLAPGVISLITSAGVMEGTAPSYSGNGYRIVGDAGGAPNFTVIDPFFSSGIHLAMTSALSAASTICASIRGDCTEAAAADWHTKRVSTSYTRFQVVVLSAYKQIRSQSDDVLSDINEDNFDRAFAYLRPVIQGASDMGKRLSENELQKSLDFCVNLFSPTSPEEHNRVAAQPHITQSLLDVAAPVIDPVVLEMAMHVGNAPPASSAPPPSRKSATKRDRSASEVAETRMVLQKINARRVVHAEYAAINNFESEPIGGYIARLEKGRLGLSRLETPFAD
ncbi:FAD binding domain-containing protein [Mycena amicta]|nr:FAD binding domain-containing protein [Mycena amicta]